MDRKFGQYKRPVSKLAHEREVQGDTERRTGVYTKSHEDSSTVSTKQFSSAVEFGNRSVEQWLEYLENKHQQEIQLGLTRIQTIADKMGLIKPACPVITVAGTNGKGSTVAALENLYKTASYRVGSYTSPHLHTFHERIKINGLPINDTDLCLAFLTVEQAAENIDLSYFEVATLAALWYFRKQNLDVMILEVGLGGRLDAVNIIDAEVAIITTIDFDHQAFLGDTLEAIGHEKAGIMRSHKPCIYADVNPPASILEQASLKQVPLLCYGKDYYLEGKEDAWIWKYKNTHLHLQKPPIQLKSAAAAMVACSLLEKKLPIDLEKIASDSLKKTFVPGRLEYIKGDVDILLDVSHNPQGTALLASYIQDLMPVGKVHAVFSALQDKDIRGLIQALRACVHAWYPAQLDSKRAASLDILRSIFQDLAITIKHFYNNPLEAFKSAKAISKPGDLIVIYGSFITVAAIRGQIHQQEV